MRKLGYTRALPFYGVLIRFFAILESITGPRIIHRETQKKPGAEDTIIPRKIPDVCP